MIEKPIEKVQTVKQEEAREEKLRVRCLECGRVFSYAEASPEIKELIWFCSSKCREKYRSLHFQRDMKRLEMQTLKTIQLIRCYGLRQFR